MKHLFLPYELALLAKNKGFDEDFFGYYDLNNKLQLITEVENNYWDPFPADYIKAPLYQQIIDWFREKNWHIRIDVCLGGKFAYRIINTIPSDNSQYIQEVSSSYYEAMNKAIDRVFKLI